MSVSTTTTTTGSISKMQATHRKPTQYESLLAGVIAGAVEGAATYPAEFVKTRAQFTANKGTVSDEAEQ